MEKVLLKIEEYETKERFSLRDILREIELIEKQEKIDYYILNIVGWGEGLNISKDYIENEFGLDYFFEYLENQVRIIKNTYVLTRYYEVLWYLKNNFLNIKRNEEHRVGFIENILLSIKEKKIKDDYRIERVLGKALNQCKKNEKLECEVFESLIKRGKEHKSAISIFNILNEYKNKKKIMVEKALELVEEEYKDFFDEQEYPHNFKSHFEILLQSYGNDSSKISELLEGVIKYFKDFKGDSMRGASYINEVLTNSIIKKLIDRGKIEKEQIEELKNLSLQFGKTIEFHLIRETIKISEEEMNTIFRIFVLDTEEKSIRGLLYEYLKTYTNSKKQSIKISKELVFRNLFSSTIYDSEGRMVAKLEKNEEKIKNEFAQRSPLYFMYFKRQLETIFEEFNIEEKYFYEQIEKSPYFNETDKIIIKKSIYYYFKGDYIIFLHLMIPRIENILRNFLEKQGGSILGQIKKDGFKYKILGNILDDEIIKEIFTEELVEYFKLVLHDDLSLNIRNNLSHGIITAGECNENNSNIVFHILLFLIYM